MASSKWRPARVALLACALSAVAAGCGDSTGSAGAAADAADSQLSVASIPAGSYAAAWGPELGGKVPLLSAGDHSGESRNLQTLAGENGLLLIFSRSTVW
ncbi:MAG: hypothetical protein AAF515_22395 [Pseudomonadota bacterium]